MRVVYGGSIVIEKEITYDMDLIALGLAIYEELRHNPDAVSLFYEVVRDASTQHARELSPGRPSVMPQSSP